MVCLFCFSKAESPMQNALGILFSMPSRHLILFGS